MSITTLRPDGTATGTAGVTFAGGAASVHGAVNDNNLATYAVGTVDRGRAWLTLQTTALGAQRVKSVQLRLQNAQGVAEASYQTAWARLRDPNTGKVDGYFQMQRQSTTVNQQRGPIVVTGAPGGLAWTQAVLDRMQLEIAWVTSQGGNYLRVHEAYVDVDLNAAPTVAAPTITGATSTTRPNVSWVYSDADGDPQTRYRVKVFSAAQYGAAGFTPDGSTATWDSADQYGSLDNADVAVNLINGTTYRAYVKVGQDWAGPEGDVWWSSWAFAGFTIAVVPPVAPALTATLDATLPGYRVLLDVLAPINLATLNQSSLETDTAGWAALANCSISRSTAFAVDGAASLQMSSTAAGTMTAEWSTRPTVRAGATYTAFATVRSAAAARTVRAGIRWYDQAGALIGSTVFGTGLTSATASNITPSVTVAAPANAYTAAVVLEVQSTAAAAELHRWDANGLQAGTSTTWTPGGNQGSAAVVLERQLRVSSNRSAPVNWAHPQIASGGAITKGVDGFSSRTTALLRSAPMDRPPPGGISNSGARMIVWHPLVGAFGGLDIGLVNAVTDDPTPPYLMPAVPGRAQTLSAYLAGSSAVNARIFVIPVDATNVQVGAGTEVASATAALPTSGWSRYTTTITPPAGTVYLRGLVELPSGSQDLDVYLTGVQCELGAAATALVPGTGLYVPTWERVRELDSTAPASPGERYTAYDHEAPPGDPVLYRARTVVGTLASAPSPVTAVLLDPPARNLLKDPKQPENALIVNMAPGWSETQSADLQVFRPLGRDQVSNGTASPLAFRDWLSGLDAAYEFAALSEVELHRLRQLAVPGATLLLQAFEGGQRYILITEDVTVSRVGPGTFRVSMNAVQTVRPT